MLWWSCQERLALVAMCSQCFGYQSYRCSICVKGKKYTRKKAGPRLVVKHSRITSQQLPAFSRIVLPSPGPVGIGIQRHLLCSNSVVRYHGLSRTNPTISPTSVAVNQRTSCEICFKAPKFPARKKGGCTLIKMIAQSLNRTTRLSHTKGVCRKGQRPTS